MVIAITAGGPDLDAPFDPDFGHCPYYCIVDTADGRCSSWGNPCAGLRADAAGKAVNLLAGLGVTRVCTGICRETARMALARAGIGVSPCQAKTVRQAVTACASPPEKAPQAPSVISHDEALASLGFPVLSPMDMAFAPRLGGRGGGRGGGGCGKGGGRGMMGGGRGGGRGTGGGRGMPGVAKSTPVQPSFQASSQTGPPAVTTFGTKGGPSRKTRNRSKAAVDSTVCTGCDACLDCCPTGALALRAGKASVDKTLCVGCGACLRACPTGAVSLLPDPPS